MTLDTRARALADNLVEQFGKEIDYRRIVPGEYDDETGTHLPDSYYNYPDLKVTPPKDFIFSKINGTLIAEGDTVVSLPALNSPVEPSDDGNDFVYMDNVEWKIRQVGKLYSGELVAMYILHLTK